MSFRKIHTNEVNIKSGINMYDYKDYCRKEESESDF